MEARDIIKSPIVTEKSMQLIEKFNKYTFKVDKKANKIEIKNAILEIFGVKVIDIATINVLPKKKRRGKYIGFTTGYKKAICKLEQGKKIPGFEI